MSSKYTIYLHDKGLTKCINNDVEQRAQPKLTMQAEGDFPFCFTALDRGLCTEAERTQVAIKQHPTRRGAQTQHSWCAPRACVSPQHTVTHSSRVLEIATQTLCFYIHNTASHSWLAFRPQNVKEICVKSWLMITVHKVLYKTSMKSSVLSPSVSTFAEHILFQT